MSAERESGGKEMLAKTQAYGLVGIEAAPVAVEVDISNGLPAFDIVGLPDAAVKEAKERVRSALRNSGFSFPVQRITVNLSPANLKKEGSSYDLPIAVAVLAATGQVPLAALGGVAMAGELSLDGAVRGVMGALPMVMDAMAKGIGALILPVDNAREGAWCDQVAIYPADTLSAVAAHLCGEVPLQKQEAIPYEALCGQKKSNGVDMADIRGQHNAKRAVEIAAAGGHNLVMVGPPGSGKTMLARSIPSVLPDLSFEEALEVTKIHSVAGVLDRHEGIIALRPFRSPHHTTSKAALTGGGAFAKPGEESLAHYGVLFLDEFPEFPRDALEALRQPLEDGFVSIARVQASMTYPARFMLVASMNPCPCGHFGSRDHECRCSPLQIQRYLGRVSGPLLDRIDLQVEVEPVAFQQLHGEAQEERSAVVKARVEQARAVQRVRLAGEGIFSNAQMNHAQMKRYCALGDAAGAMLKQAFAKLKMSARGYSRVLKVARTIADLAGSEQIEMAHVAEAVQYRSLDKKYW